MNNDSIDIPGNTLVLVGVFYVYMFLLLLLLLQENRSIYCQKKWVLLKEDRLWLPQKYRGDVFFSADVHVALDVTDKNDEKTYNIKDFISYFVSV